MTTPTRIMPIRMAPACARESGMALLVVLWTLILLSVIAASLSTEARKQGYLTRNAQGLARAEAAADGGIVRGVAGLLDPRIEMRWVPDGHAYHFALDGIMVAVRVVDEASKLDLNNGPPELLSSLLQVVGADEASAFSVTSAVVALRTGAATGQPSGFETTTELMGMPGMTADLYQRVAPFITVFTHATGVDPSLASQVMLLALNGGNASAAEAALSARTASLDGGAPASPATGGQVAESQHSVYAIEARAQAGSASFTRQAIVRLTHSADIPFLVHSWQRLPSPTPENHSRPHS